MPCIFCIAMVMAGAGAIAASTIELMQVRLQKKTGSQVKKVSDTSSVARLEFGMKSGKKTVPIALTVFKEHRRVRIQVLTHDVSRPEAEKIENQIADLLDLKIVDRSSAEDEAKVREAFGHGPHGEQAPAEGAEPLPDASPGRVEPPPLPDRS
jgi:hypothetical protein